MSLDPSLLAILACPCEHHASLHVDREPANSLVCQRCLTTFPVRHGIPVLLLDDATPGPEGIGADLGERR
ncbi:MAG: Trm112 family protein [Actinomycetes bacterium]